MTAPPDPTTVVQNQVFPPGPQPADAILMYDGALPAYYPWAQTPTGGWYAWDMRSVLFTFVHDLLRCMPIDQGKPPTDRSQPEGIRDTINNIWYLTDQNNRILQKLASVANIDISAILSA